MFKRKDRGINSLTLSYLESLDREALAEYLKSLENITLQRIQNTYTMGKLSEKQVLVDRAVFWELYSRERPSEEPEVLTSSDPVQDVDHRIRSRRARDIKNIKDAHVKEKRRLAKEAAIASKCGHTSAIKKSPRTASPTVESDDVVDLRDVRWDVHLQRYEDDVDEYMLLLAELAENEP